MSTFYNMSSKIRIASQYFEKDALPLRILRDSMTERVGHHTHTFYVIGLIDRGFGYHLCNNQSDFLISGSVLGVGPGVPHGFTGATELNCIYCIFTPELLDSLDKRIVNLPGLKKFFKTGGSLTIAPLDNDRMTALHTLLTNIETEVTENPAAWEVMARSNLIALLVLLARYCETADTEQNADAHMPLVGKAVLYIQDHFTEDMNSADIAAHVGLSYDYFIRLFKNVTGQTPAEYIRGYRMGQAMTLLQETDWPVSDIAAKVGVADVSIFSRQFKKVKGVSPSEARKGKA